MPRQVKGTPRAVSRSGPSISWKWTCGSVELPELPQRAELLPGPDPVARADGERAALEVGVHGVRAVAEVEDDVVARDPAGAAHVPDGRLDQHQVQNSAGRSCG